MPDINVRGADVVAAAMSQFKEVLDGVRLALTWASPAEVQALLQGLVEEQIISEAYSKSLSVHRLAERIAPEPVPSPTACKPRGSTTHLNQSQLNQVRKCGSSKPRESAVTDQTRSKPASSEMYPPSDECRLGLDDEITELLRSAESMQKPESDNVRMYEGNLEDEKEWLEQVEEAARRIAVPLWQHWDRGRRMLLPLVPCMTTGCLTSEKTVIDSEAQCPLLNMEEETELAITCRTLDLYALNFECTKAEITDFTLDTEGATDTPQGLYLSTYDSLASTGLNKDHFNVFALARNASPVQTCAATDTNRKITARLEGDVCWVDDRTTYTTEDLLCLTADIHCGTDAGFTEDIAHLFSPCTPKNSPTDAQDTSFCSNTDHSMTLGVIDNIEDVFRTAYSTKTCSTDGITDFLESKEDEEGVHSHWGKFALNHHTVSCPMLALSVLIYMIYLGL